VAYSNFKDDKSRLDNWREYLTVEKEKKKTSE